MAGDWNLDSRNLEKMQKRQRQTEAKNTAPQYQPPAGMVAAQYPMGQPAQREQASPFEKDSHPRRSEQERRIHFDFLLAFWGDAQAAV
jgi:hypothetical protein